VLFPNQFVNIQLLVDTLQDTTVVPTAAVQRGAPGTFVYVVNPDNTVKVTPIKIGPIQGESTSVTSGIAPGTQVVVDGADKLKDNAKIALRQESPKVPSQNPNVTAPGNGTTTPSANSPAAPPAPSATTPSASSRRGSGPPR